MNRLRLPSIVFVLCCITVSLLPVGAPAVHAQTIIPLDGGDGFSSFFLDDEQSDGLYNTAVMFIQEEEYETALTYLEAATAVDPEHPKAWYWIGWILLDDRNRLDEAIDAFLRHLEFNPSDGGAHNDLGVGYARSGQNFDALLSYTRAAVLEPTPLHLANLGTTLVNHYNRPDLAYEQFVAITKMDHPNAERQAERLLRAIYPEL